jgi:lysophospholipase L1-like esterase
MSTLWAIPARADFVIRDGDTVVFLGDSITAARAYGKIVENYTLLRFPDRKVHFVNAGWGGDTAAGGLKRLERDVFSQGATVLTVAYGINDIGWGAKADDEHKRQYLEAIRGIVTQCQERGVRVFICSAAITGADPSKSEEDFLQKMCDEGMDIARSLGVGAIDVQRTMRSIQKNVWAANANAKEGQQKETLHAADGIHLNDLGQLAMAFAILKGLGAPADVSSVVIDAAKPELVAAKACQVTHVSGDAAHLQFDRLDEGLPLNFGPLGALQFRFVPVPAELNRYMLTVSNLKPGRYDILVDDRPLGTFSQEQLARGLNIGSATADGWEPGGTWDVQCTTLIALTDARNELAQSQRIATHYSPQSARVAALRTPAQEINARLEDLQRATVRPQTYHFLIRPATEKKAQS